MKKDILAVILMLFFINASANAWTGNLNILLGKKLLDEDDWSPLNTQAMFGFVVDFKQQDWPVSIALDILRSEDSAKEAGAELEGATSEFDVGVRKFWVLESSLIRPYIGGGLAFVNAEIRTTNLYTTVEEDSSTGFWLNSGVYWTIEDRLNIGLDFRYSQAGVTLAGIDTEAGGVHVGMILGRHW